MTLQSPTPIPEPRYLTVAEVARRLNKNEDVVRRLCRNGELPSAFRENGGSPWQILESGVDANWHNDPAGTLSGIEV